MTEDPPVVMSYSSATMSYGGKAQVPTKRIITDRRSCIVVKIDPYCRVIKDD